jgi:Gas vesicle synthesis protein GvpL/GvpF
MKYLVYCIFARDKDAGGSDIPVGVGGSPAYVVENNGLCATVSAVSDDRVLKESSTILAYHRVIESFHNEFGAIPLRFGTLVDDEEEIRRVLETHGKRYKDLLKQLVGRVEMGIRIISNESPAKSYLDNEKKLNFYAADSPVSGAAYLANRKARLDELGRADERNRRIIAKYRGHFEGLFAKFKSEARKSGSRDSGSNAIVLSLYFLVPRQSLAAFRQAYDKLKSSGPVKIMLSGPWPPYNFVLPDDM